MNKEQIKALERIKAKWAFVGVPYSVPALPRPKVFIYD